MTKLLISVTSVEEAQLALDSGGDIIDLKDPHSGALGALPLPVTLDIVHHIRRTQNPKPISATIGDIPMQANLILQKINALAVANVDFIKIGFFDTEDYASCLTELKSITSKVNLVAVLFAEHTYPANIVEKIQQTGFKGVMLDTVQKNGRTVLYYRDIDYYRTLSKKVIDLGMTFGLAGSLKLQDLGILSKIQPSYMGFRGGVCFQNARTASLEKEKITELKTVIENML